MLKSSSHFFGIPYFQKIEKLASYADVVERQVAHFTCRVDSLGCGLILWIWKVTHWVQTSPALWIFLTVKIYETFNLLHNTIELKCCNIIKGIFYSWMKVIRQIFLFRSISRMENGTFVGVSNIFKFHNAAFEFRWLML